MADELQGEPNMEVASYFSARFSFQHVPKMKILRMI
jgi:hypothetical protein